MASNLFFNLFLFYCLFFSIIIFPSIAKTSFRPKALLLPLYKDPSTLQYLTKIKQRTPLVPIKLTVDLGAEFLWVDCEQGYVSSTFKSPLCSSAPCSLLYPKICGRCVSPTFLPGCNIDNICIIHPYNPLIWTFISGRLSQDMFSIQTTNGFNPGRHVSLPNFLFSCGDTSLLQGLASGVKGMAGLGRTKIGLPYQFAAAFSLKRKFAICLSSSTRSKGVIFFGDGPFAFLPNIDLSKSLTYTPLLINPISTGGFLYPGKKSADYFIGVKSIKINDKVVHLNTSLLSIDNKGRGGTKISTVDPYSVLETSIYNAFIDAFEKAMGDQVTRVAAVEPFGACFNSTGIGSTRVGAAVPTIDLVLQNNNVFWRIFGANSMVEVRKDVLCLGFVDGGVGAKASIVIGGHQLEDNFLQFELDYNRLGFSSSLLFRQTTCSNFNFTTN
ncbi:probable aspartic proteinase GIP2 isoform X1 [Ziziphus jujuba]|uniref:Probable aspartic proteinase GIP2 isoform X1 n=1 Tax=Ziziphus jujuba TaxID=326968 RepID=A0A6P3YXZ5_ZIZJJ|nr:probable aspartic proteinase GIP2 isoform X1 [Ziziphus jujuba]